MPTIQIKYSQRKSIDCAKFIIIGLIDEGQPIQQSELEIILGRKLQYTRAVIAAAIAELVNEGRITIT